MPIYDYACLSCGTNFEIVRKITQSSAAKCPKCGAGKTERRIVPPNFILKGAGFHVNDYKAGAAKPEAKPEAKPAKAEKAAPPAPKKEDKAKT